MTGADVKQARCKLRLSQQKLADLCGLTQGWVSQIEQERRSVPVYMQTIITLAQHTPAGLDVCLEALNAAD